LLRIVREERSFDAALVRMTGKERRKKEAGKKKPERRRRKEEAGPSPIRASRVWV
jgi:hypothetical protein